MSENRTPEEKGDDLLKGLGYETQEGSGDVTRGIAYGSISFSVKWNPDENRFEESEPCSDVSFVLPKPQMPRIIVVDGSGQRWSTKWVDGKLFVDERLDD